MEDNKLLRLLHKDPNAGMEQLTEATDDLIRVKQKDGTDFTLPPDLNSTKRARQGEYKLRSTGEVVVNPDFLATWNLNRAKEE